MQVLRIRIDHNGRSRARVHCRRRPPRPVRERAATPDEMERSLVGQGIVSVIEGNTISAGDTLFVLTEGLTVSGKSLREHQELHGHRKDNRLEWRIVDAGGPRNRIRHYLEAGRTDQNS